MSETNDDSVPQDLNENIDYQVNKIVGLLENEILGFGGTENYGREKFAVLHQLETDFEATKSILRVTIDEASVLCDSLGENYACKKNESSKLHVEFKNLDDKYKILVKEYENLEEQCLELKSKLNISNQDKFTLELDIKKLDLYEKATNIVWDYSVPINSTISGCVRNKTKNYLQTFAFKKDENSAKDAQNELWGQIEKGLLDNCYENNEIN